MKWHGWTLWPLLLLTTVAMADVRFRDLSDPDAPKWTEDEAVPPEFPKTENLLPFYVSEMTAHRFMIDASTLQVGKDGVVRYVLVVQTSGGATNISFEGIRCDAREFRLYASGHREGRWTKARLSEWRPIENKPVNRHHAALSRDLFCPNGVAIYTPDEGRDALRRGKHPEAL
ncbi:MAG: CNP1-like family protein [Rhodocyclaceae bacterium]|nr:CNP1-like family protein [Rhodocyclaceae bacterium]MDZ4215009.1 CNP1-like family protein [Rhodocyclaceae bacterium]